MYQIKRSTLLAIARSTVKMTQRGEGMIPPVHLPLPTREAFMSTARSVERLSLGWTALDEDGKPCYCLVGSMRHARGEDPAPLSSGSAEFALGVNFILAVHRLVPDYEDEIFVVVEDPA